MSKGYFVRITKIDKIPSPNLSNYVEVTGEALIIDSLGAEVTVCFYEVSSNNAGLAWPLGVKDAGDFQHVEDDDHEDGEFYQEGEYVLTIDDYLARRTFADEICRNSYPVDVHQSKDEIEQNIRGEVHGMGRYEHYGKGESHGIPYRCLIPRGLSNVLVAGRSISTDRDTQGARA